MAKQKQIDIHCRINSPAFIYLNPLKLLVKIDLTIKNNSKLCLLVVSK